MEVVTRLRELFRGRNLRLSVAESCTGGLVSHYLTLLPGASTFFEAGVVAYSARSKEGILGVSSVTISDSGVVSEATAREMAERVRSLAGTDYALSTTGNLGPDVLEGKERGLVYIAVSSEGGTLSRQMRLTGDRLENKESAALGALRLLLEVVEGAEA